MSSEVNENERYARADVQGGFIYNKSEIDYFKQTQTIDVMSNLMLGDYNKKGAYVIDKGIIDQLVKVKKYYQYSFGSTTFCQSANDIGGYGKIDFAIKMRNNSQTKMVTSTLQLLETIDRANGYYQNTNTATIAVYSAPESNSYIVDMLKYFNVVSKKEDGLLHKDRDEEEVDLIIARKKYEEMLKNGSLDKIESINKSLFEKRLKILSKSAVGKKILAQFNNEQYKINGWFVKEGMPGYYRYLNQILDGLLEVHSAEVLQDVALTAALRKANETAAIEMGKTMENVQNAAKENVVENLAQNVAQKVEGKQMDNQLKEAKKTETSKESFEDFGVKPNSANTQKEQVNENLNQNSSKRELIKDSLKAFQGQVYSIAEEKTQVLGENRETLEKKNDVNKSDNYSNVKNDNIIISYSNENEEILSK